MPTIPRIPDASRFDGAVEKQRGAQVQLERSGRGRIRVRDMTGRTRETRAWDGVGGSFKGK